MYTVVLMVAMTGGAEAPEFGCRRCNGCSGCNGCFCNGGCRGCRGCRGGCWSGCCGGSCWGGGCGGGFMHSPGGTGGGTIIEKKTMPKGAGKVSEDEVSAPATIIVTLPAEARLTIDGAPTTSMSNRRTFTTPPLQPGADYAYTFRAEIMRDGRPVVETQTVTVHAGRTTEVPFNLGVRGGVAAAP